MFFGFCRRRRVSQPSLPHGASLAICDADQHIYVVGHAATGQRPNGGTPMWHIEMLRRTDGALAETWSGPAQLGQLWACSTAGGKLVALGDSYDRCGSGYRVKIYKLMDGAN
ncbi:MAG: hypothetical protein ACPL3C_12980 [Pyrobaculum sp.]